ncbi:MAG: hypothetical protein H6708_19155 [Kofleriaceae bacterium]|nr:hypothetical protein [Kofleriaceae bacterium]
MFFLLMSLGLIASSVLGIVMAFQYRRDRRIIIGLLSAGIILPVGFLLLL